jgi:hypothetical protein
VGILLNETTFGEPILSPRFILMFSKRAMAFFTGNTTPFPQTRLKRFCVLGSLECLYMFSVAFHTFLCAFIEDQSFKEGLMVSQFTFSPAMTEEVAPKKMTIIITGKLLDFIISLN